MADMKYPSPIKDSWMTACFILLASLLVNLATAEFHQPAPKGFPELYVWTDTCNSYIIRDGDSALLFDLGDGGSLAHLDKIGVRQVEWILFTHHHREQCQGIGKVDRKITKVAAP